MRPPSVDSFYAVVLSANESSHKKKKNIFLAKTKKSLAMSVNISWLIFILADYSVTLLFLD